MPVEATCDQYRELLVAILSDDLLDERTDAAREDFLTWCRNRRDPSTKPGEEDRYVTAAKILEVEWLRTIAQTKIGRDQLGLLGYRPEAIAIIEGFRGRVSS